MTLCFPADLLGRSAYVPKPAPYGAGYAPEAYAYGEGYAPESPAYGAAYAPSPPAYPAVSHRGPYPAAIEVGYVQGEVTYFLSL